jgi:urate oxidase
MAALAENRYGKSRVRLARVKRTPEKHEFREWTVEILLQGDFESCFSEGDNSKILPTDTMKNTVYSLARSSSAEYMEDFAKELVDFLLQRNPQVSQAEVGVWEKCWERLPAGDKKQHPTAFLQSSAERQTTRATRMQGGKFTVVSGLEDLLIMKTAGSAFEGYIKDSLTTLPESSDRLFCTSVRSNWTYTKPDLPFDALRNKIRTTLLNVFADHASKSVQHTLYAMGEKVLKDVAEVDDIDLVMPNRHYIPADLSKFGQDNPNEIFVPTDEPHGHIEARIRRHG